MTDTRSKLIKSASATLTKLTKIRCVKAFALPPSCEPKNFFSWPNTRYLDEESSHFLEARGVQLRDSHVKTFSVPYSSYDEMEKVDVASVGTIETTRVLLDVFQLVAEDKPVTKITAIWDAEEHPERIAPTSTSDTQRMQEFGAHRDSYLVFRREGEEYDIKLRPSAFPVVLQAKPELSGLDISPSDLRKFAGRNVDSRARKNRNIVFEAHSDYLRDVVNQTNDAVEKLVENDDLVSAVKEHYRAH